MSTPFDRPSSPNGPDGPGRPGGAGGPGPQRPTGASRRPGALVITAIILIVAFMLLSGFASFWTERLWFGSVGYGEVFTTLLLTRAGLFLVFAGLMAAVVALSMAMAYRFRPMIFPGMPGVPDDGMDRYRQVLGPRMTWVIAGAAAVMGLFAGASATGQWRNYSLWRHSQPFGKTDPYFGKDAGFYVFELPFWHYLVDYVMALAVVGLLASIVVNYLFGGIRLAARPGERLTSAAQIQVSALLALFVLAKAVDYWLDRFDLVTSSGPIFTGPGYTDDNAVLPGKEILAGIAIVCALLFLANIWRRTWLLPSVGVALFALSAIVLGLIVPTVVQAIRVNPNVPVREGPYIKENIDATREAYALDDVEMGSVSGSEVPAEGRLEALDEKTANVPLVDPQVVSDVFEQQQQVRGYYSVSDVLDVDRYEIEGVDRAVVLGVRELDQDALDEGDRNWSNLHTVYTHGDGVIAAYANQRPADDSEQSLSIQWAQGQQADEDALTSLSPEGVETRVYFGEQSPTYSIVGKADDGQDVELVLPSSQDEEEGESPETTYDGEGGVPVGSLFHKLLYAVKFSEPNFVLSSLVNENSKVLYDRNPRTMVEKVAPWLTVDSDPYPVVVDGRIQWVLDGYTVTDKYPLSQRESLETMTDDSLQQNNGFQTLPTDEINYMRNSVKATVDAYDGTVRLYAWEESDPILQAWQEVFPGLIEPREEIPENLVPHLRYPEDLFKAQRYQFQRYHETSAADWFEGSTRWEVPKDPQASTRLQPPYRLFSEAAGEPTWALTSVYVPRERDNLAAYMSVNSDATSEDYGKISVLELPDTRTDGPRLIAAALSTDETVRQELLSFTQGDATPVFGNLLTLPIGDSFMYVQPLYTRRDDESAYPILRFVLVSYQGRVGIGETLRDAIADSLDGAVAPDDGEEPETEDPETEDPETEDPEAEPTESPAAEPTETPTTPVPGGTQAQIRRLLVQAEAKFTEADEAQQAGDTVRWARLMEEGRELIEEAVRLAG
ncbi:UPF0182 family protein [Nocardioides sp. SYSU D00065]|uniref:UPF0182 family membrane protein n=1 Tax=Nocardioides sp. SYSU D00065 TaxID=2817378 RepID=UPI001B342EAF|nr:UPF0182 family protein [Nocardioides sp. SYSU D00065]